MAPETTLALTSAFAGVAGTMTAAMLYAQKNRSVTAFFGAATLAMALTSLESYNKIAPYGQNCQTLSGRPVTIPYVPAAASQPKQSSTI